jgi:arylsulfatase A-like enzyme
MIRSLSRGEGMHRREFLRSAAAVPAAAALPHLSEGADSRPNILIIMADDMGFSDIGCFGSEIPTPNLDKLAREGVRLTQFYNCARCCPTRASLLTGLYSHQAGVGHMIAQRPMPGYQGYLNNRCVTLAEALRPAGYRVAMSGKWHVGEDRPHWPTDRGFEQYFGLISGASNYFRLDKGRKMALNDQPFTPGEGFYMTDAITDYAVKFMEGYGSKREPFLLYAAYTAPHWPLHALPRDIERHRGKYLKGWDVLRRERHERQVAMGIVDRRWPLTPRDSEVPAWETVSDKAEKDLRMAVYAAQIDRLDQCIGRLLGTLRRLRIDDNTLVIFLADNGGCAEENISGEKPLPPGPADSFTSYGRPWANASNTPFRLYKHWVHEGGIASPFIARWPRRIRQHNKIASGPAHVIDIMATCLDASGASYPTSFRDHEILPLEGKSLLPLLRDGSRAGHEALFWEHEGNKAVRMGNQKIVSRYPDRWEIYDLERDRTETKDLSAERPASVAELASRYDSWANRCQVLPWDVVRVSK